MDFNFKVAPIRIDVVHHLEGEALTLLRDLKSQGERMHQDYLDLAKKIDDATTAVANRIDKLSGQIKNSMTDEEVAQVKAAFQAEVDRLTALGADPVNPVPVVP